jgi:hypothetical protein
MAKRPMQRWRLAEAARQRTQQIQTAFEIKNITERPPFSSSSCAARVTFSSISELYHWRQARLYSLKKGLLATNSPTQPACTDGAKGLDWLANGKDRCWRSPFILLYSNCGSKKPLKRK